MKQVVKSSGSKGGFKAVLSRKKRRGGVFEDNAGAKKGSAKVQSGCSWSSETGDTTESNSVNMEEECLVEETSFDYGEGGAHVGLWVTTRKALEKSLGKIDFLDDNNNDDVLLDALLVFSPPLKNLVNVSVRKLFALDLDLKAVEENLAQEKFKKIRSLFSGINGFGGASTPSKFSEIIRAIFTSESGLMKANEKATGVNILVNTDFKRSAGHSDRAVVLKEIPVGTSAEAVHAALSEFRIIKSIKMQLQSDHADLVAAKWSILIGKDAVWVARSNLDKESWDTRDQHRALLYTLLMEMTAHDIWDFIGSVGGKTCVIDHHPIMYARARCAVICFDSAELLDAIVGTTPVLRGTNLHWFCFVSAKCAKSIGGRISSGLSSHRVLSDTDKSKLAAIYAKRSAPVVYRVSFSGLSWAKVASGSSFLFLSGRNASVKSGSSSEMVPSLPVSMKVNNRFAALEHSLASLAEQMGKLAKRLNVLGPMVSQPSPGCQPLVTPSSQNQGVDIVMGESSGAATSGEIVVGVVSFDVSLVSKLEDSMKCLMETVLGLSAKVDSFGTSMNNLAKQNDVIHWHMEKNNLVSIFTESKLKGKIRPWIVFTFGLESRYLGAGVAVVMNSSLARHVYKVSEMPGRLLSIKLLFKNKLSVFILGLYAGAFLAVWFSQAGKVNSLIAKAVNKSFFIILGGDFNKNSSHKCASFKKCLDLGLVNALGGSFYGKLPTWSNSWGITKMIDFMFVSSNLVNAIVSCDVFGIGEYFDTDHQTVSVLVSWVYDYKGANDVKWAKFKDDTVANAAMFHDDFLAARVCSDLDLMWVAFHRVMCLSAEAVFKKKWFKEYDKNFSKDSSKFHKLELFVSKLVKAFHMDSAEKFTFLLGRWKGLDLVNASAVKSLFLSGSHFNAIRSVLSKVKKSYHASKMLEADRVRESQIRSAIDKRMESFELDKDHTIRSVLEHSFCKVILNHLVVDDELVLEPALVKAKVDASLEYVFDDAFSGVISLIDFDEMSSVVSNLPDGKAAGLSGISNELWKHCDKLVLDMLLVFLNVCLERESVSGPWKEAWVLMIPKPYEWEGILTNTYPIALVETIHNDRVNRVMTDFGLTDGYQIHDGLNQGEVFSPLLWCIFYDPFLCEVKRQESVCGYRLDSHFVANTGLSKPSLAKTCLDVWFFTNLVLRKAISDKQFLYLVSVVLHSIIAYRTQFSFVPISVCAKWDAIIRKGLKSKSGLPLNFPNDAIHHPSLYRLKSFEQVQAESKLAAVQWKRLDLWGPIPDWFNAAVCFLSGSGSSPVCSLLPLNVDSSDILESCKFDVVCNCLLEVDSDHLSLFTDGSLCGLGTLDMKADAAVFFEDIDLGLGVEVSGLVFSTMTELQAIALALECVPSSCSVDLFSDSQAALDACKSELMLEHLDFRNRCWVECCHISNVIHCKNLDVNWIKVRGHSGVLGNKHADTLARAAVSFGVHLPHGINEHFFKAGSTVVSGNSRHFVCGVFHSIHRAHWEVSSGSQILVDSLCTDVDWFRSCSVWHPDSHLATGFTSACIAGSWTYFIKALHHHLSVAV
ncbi:hypothetical protein G9A89_012694 [Geosiphon pyriformis]|nr:hypothetical protein G9A89_012694 [Geosiphon pyriformis]